MGTFFLSLERSVSIHQMSLIDHIVYITLEITTNIIVNSRFWRLSKIYCFCKKKHSFLIDLTTGGKVKRVLWNYIFRQILLIGLLYMFICSLDFLSSAFRLLGGKTLITITIHYNSDSHHKEMGIRSEVKSTSWLFTILNQ